MLTPEEVRHVAMLARLGLSDEEVERLRTEMLDVLNYIDVLREVDTSAIAPTAQVLTQRTVVRPDLPRPSWPVADILSNAPDSDNQFFKVPTVLEEDRGGAADWENETAGSEVAGDGSGEEEIG